MDFYRRSESIKLYTIKKQIDDELMQNGQYSIDILLLYYKIDDVLDLLETYSRTYYEIVREDPYQKKFLFLYMQDIVNFYNKALLLVDRQILHMLIKKSKLPSNRLYKKENISFINNQSREDRLLEILDRLKRCVLLYYNVYNKKKIELELSDKKKIKVQFFEHNLPHILGITKQQILSNPETMSILNLKHTDSAIDILYKIINDFDRSQHIIEEQTKRKHIVDQQFLNPTCYELLPFDKIDLKTRAFMKNSPYTHVTTFVSLAQGERLTNQNDCADQVQIARRPLVDYGDGSPTIDDYILTGYGENKRLATHVPISSIVVAQENIKRYRKKFKSQKPHTIISVKCPVSDYINIFSPKEQIQVYYQLLEDFGGDDGMDLSELGREILEFINSYEDRVEKEYQKRLEMKNLYHRYKKG